MIDAYKIGVSIAMSNGVSSVLAVIQKDVLGLRAAVDLTNGGFSKMKVAIGGLAGVTFGAGMLAGLYKLSGAAERYTEQLNTMRMAGINGMELAQSVSEAWKIAGTIPTTTATGNLKALLDMRNNLVGGLPEAIKMLPITAKIATVMAASSDKKLSGSADDIAFAVAKGMDIMGYNTADQMEHGAARMSQVISAFQNRVSPDAIAATTFYARQARYDMDDFMRWGVVPSMMLERAGSGGSKGIGPSLAAVNRMAVVGTMTKKSAEWFSSLGLLHGPQVKTTTTGVQTAGLDDQKAWSSNAFIATWKDLVPAMQKKYGAGIVDDPSKMRAIIAGSGMTQMAMSQVMEWVTKPGNVLRDAQNVGVLPDLKLLPPALRDIATKLGLDPTRGAMPYDKAYDEARAHSPRAARLALGDSWDNLQVAIGKLITPTTVAMMDGLAAAIVKVAKIVNDHPTATKWLLGVAAGLGAVLVVAGTVAIAAAAFAAIGWIPLAIGAVGAAIIALGIAVAADWDQIKAFGTMIGESLGRVVSAVRDFIIGLAGDVWKWIKHPFASGSPSEMPSGWKPETVGPAGSISQRLHDSPAFQSNIADLRGSLRNAYDLPPAPSASRAPAPAMSDAQFDAKYGDIFKQAMSGLKVEMDGREVGKIVADHMGNDLSRPPSSTSMFDTRQSPLFSGAP